MANFWHLPNFLHKLLRYIKYHDTLVGKMMPKFFWNKVFLKNSHLCSTRLQNRNLYWIFLDEVGSDQSGGILSLFMSIACSDNGLSLGRRQAIIWISAWLLSTKPLGTHFSEIISIKTQSFSFTRMHLKKMCATWRPFCPPEGWGVNSLRPSDAYMRR